MPRAARAERAGKTTTLEMLEDIQTPSREFYRDHAGLGWNIFMPILMVLAFAFSGPPEDLLKIGVLRGPDGDRRRAGS